MGCYYIVAFGVLACFVMITIIMIMILFMIFFILIIVIITQPLAGHFVDRVRQHFSFTCTATYRSPSP